MFLRIARSDNLDLRLLHCRMGSGGMVTLLFRVVAVPDRAAPHKPVFFLLMLDQASLDLPSSLPAEEGLTDPRPSRTLPLPAITKQQPASKASGGKPFLVFLPPVRLYASWAIFCFITQRREN